MPATSISEGSLIAGRYRLVRHLGEGGMGTVWAATHTVTRRAVAIKFLKESVQNKPEIRQRFLREATAVSSLVHPNVVQVLDVFDGEDQLPVMVMELLEGETLGAKLLREERLSTEETAAIVLPVVSAVCAAHAAGIVHRDLKPDNVFIVSSQGLPVVKVLDFGIAKIAAERYFELGQSILQTEAGAILGTPCYMAPEQLATSAVDARADIWSLGVILYECLSGTRPVEGRNLAEVIARLTTGAITPLDRVAPELPSEVTGIVQQMLARDVNRRLHDLGELVKVLSRYDRATPAPPLPIVASGQPRPAMPVSAASQKRAAIGPTLISAAALGISTLGVDSTDATSSSKDPEPKPSRRPPLVALIATVALLLLVWAVAGTGVLSRRGQPASAAQSSVMGAVPPLIPAAPGAAPASVAPTPSPSETALARVPATIAHSSPPASPSPRPSHKMPPAIETRDDTLFSGRK